MKLKVGIPEQQHDIANDEVILAVPYAITDDEGTTLTERIQAFPLSVTAEEVKTALTQALSVYKDAVERFEASKTLQEGLDNASKVTGEITNLSIE